MSEKPVLNIALVGYAFMGRAHSNAFGQICRFFADCPFDLRRKVMVARSADKVAAAAKTWGWEESSTDYAAVLARDDIDVVDITTPPNGHYALAKQALLAGKHVLCEKPLAMDVAEAKELAELARKKKRICGVWHAYRFSPAASTAAQICREGKLGEIRHVRAQYLQDWLVDPTVGAGWRTQKKIAGSGSHGDLNAHLIDMTRFITGLEIDEVSGLGKTFIDQRPSGDGKTLAKVDVDDAFLFLARLSNGGVASYEATRFAPGHKNTNFIEVNGSKGSLRWDFHRMNELQFFSFEDAPHVQGWHNIMCLDSAAHPYAGSWWPNGHHIGYEHCFTNMLYEYLQALAAGKPFRPDFADGVAVQEVVDAALASAKSRAWVKIKRSQRFNGPAFVRTPRASERNAGL
jgi:predicted dehydrogenase